MKKKPKRMFPEALRTVSRWVVPGPGERHLFGEKPDRSEVVEKSYWDEVDKCVKTHMVRLPKEV